MWLLCCLRFFLSWVFIPISYINESVLMHNRILDPFNILKKYLLKWVLENISVHYNFVRYVNAGKKESLYFCQLVWNFLTYNLQLFISFVKIISEKIFRPLLWLIYYIYFVCQTRWQVYEGPFHQKVQMIYFSARFYCTSSIHAIMIDRNMSCIQYYDIIKVFVQFLTSTLDKVL